MDEPQITKLTRHTIAWISKELTTLLLTIYYMINNGGCIKMPKISHIFDMGNFPYQNHVFSNC
jgi:hypothetical protein